MVFIALAFIVIIFIALAFIALIALAFIFKITLLGYKGYNDH